MMRRQTARIRALLDQLLDVSGVISGKVPMTLEPVDIVETVIGAVETVNPLIESRKQRLETSTPAKGGTFVLGDEVRLSQAIENLLTTAANHSDDEGIIRLTVEPDYDEVRISVRHDGVSIDDAHLEHIFEVFARGDDPLHQSERGLALSLPLARELVARHGGSIHAKRAGDDGGTVFTITLPRLQRPPSPNAEDERPGRHTGQGTSLRILVVDDETDAAASLADVLKLLGHTTRVAHDGPSALGAVKSFDPEIVLLDLGLPGMDGYEVARRLRHEVSRSGTLLVALTGYPKETGRLEGAGFDDHLIKPVDLQKLQRWLRHLFS
jgi:CheY-like chemotaxis protein